ncbi:MBL fold metallo-hydrolase [Aeromonas jandaei]|uniref:MBL fold metallo-hydrolase n=1 Tax=Aeromonas jandaei TaxID=650 RepID=UPI0011176BDA|nr:MBL fold metallo-hydrolase [Aeromonas jandaei]TNI02821.1 MBL fold metallo-hydrolase [Aeromonas jandaei]
MKQTLKAVALAIGCALAAAPAGAASQGVQLTPLDKNFTLQVLGSGGPISDDQRASSSEVIWWKGKSRILIDAGGGVYLRFGQAGAKLEEVDFIGITHFHTDHVTDLPALLKGAYFFERSDPLDLAGPEAGSAFPSMSGYFDALFNKEKGAYAYLSGFKDGTDGLFPITLIDVPYRGPKPHTVYQQDGLTITALGIPHGDVPCLAYRIQSAEGSIVISADQNGSNPAFLDFARGADILVMPLAIHEGADPVSASLHAKPSVVAKIAAEVNPKLLVLNHWMGLGLSRKSEALDIVKSQFHGQIVAARDLSSYPVSSVKESTHE